MTVGDDAASSCVTDSAPAALLNHYFHALHCCLAHNHSCRLQEDIIPFFQSIELSKECTTAEECYIELAEKASSSTRDAAAHRTCDCAHSTCPRPAATIDISAVIKCFASYAAWLHCFACAIAVHHLTGRQVLQVACCSCVLLLLLVSSRSARALATWTRTSTSWQMAWPPGSQHGRHSTPRPERLT